MLNYFTPKKSQSKKNQILDVTIARLDSEGRGVANVNQKPVFISGALPTERVKIKIIEQKNKFATAQLLDVIEPSLIRVEPKCQHFNQCGGCDLQHVAHAEQLKFKQQNVSALLSRQQINEPLPWWPALTANRYHYRRKARIGVQYNKQQQAIIGFRRKSTNALLPISRCAVLAPCFDDLFSQLQAQLSKLTVMAAIGHIEVIMTNEVTLVIRQLKSLNQPDIESWLAFAAQHNYQILIDNGNNINQLTASYLTNPELPSQLSYELTGGQQPLKLAFNSADFIQINAEINQRMILQAIDWLALKPQDLVLDLFCGLGNFSLPLSELVAKVVGVEGVPNMVRQAEQNAKLNRRDNCEFYHADLNATWPGDDWTRQNYSVVLLDPARAGALVAVQQVLQLDVEKILYVSCDPTTLARDAQVLVAAGYQIDRIALVDMFSQTKHIETMILFKR